MSMQKPQTQPDRYSDRIVLQVTVAAIVLLCAMAVSCCLGSAHISIGEVIKYFTGRKDELSRTTVVILQRIRLPRVAMGALVGGALATVGAVMQGIFRNPMADPSVLGISSGSALGAAIAIICGLDGAIIGGTFTGTYIGAMIGLGTDNADREKEYEILKAAIDDREFDAHLSSSLEQIRWKFTK